MCEILLIKAEAGPADGLLMVRIYLVVAVVERGRGVVLVDKSSLRTNRLRVINLRSFVASLQDEALDFVCYLRLVTALKMGH